MPPEVRLDESGAPAFEGVAVFSGTAPLCREFGLVLDAKGLGYDQIPSGDAWALVVAPAVAEAASLELARYAAERVQRREVAVPFVAFGGSAMAAAVYAGILILTAYCAGIQAFEVDWLTAGALDAHAAAAGEWWRPVTALTLHLDQEHLLGNLLFGMGIGTLAARMFGPGWGWLCILSAGTAANVLDMWLSPAGHRAVGASTAVFAALGLLAGFGWGERRDLRERRLYRWGPLAAGVCLLALLGAGDEHVDVLGHLLGFVVGTALGWAFARATVPRTRSPWLQWVCGASAVALVATAWIAALGHSHALGR